MSRRTFHRNALGTIFTVAGMVLIARAVCAWSNTWPAVIGQALVGALGGGWLARRSYPELRIPDAAVAGGLGAVLVVGLSHLDNPSAPFLELVISSVIAAVGVPATMHVLRASEATTGRFGRMVHAAPVVWSSGLLAVAILYRLMPDAGDALLGAAVFAGGFIAILLIPKAEVWEVALGLAGSVLVVLPVMIVIDSGTRAVGFGFFVALIAAFGGGGIALLGAGIGLLFKVRRPALSDVELVPPARIER